MRVVHRRLLELHLLAPVLLLLLSSSSSRFPIGAAVVHCSHFASHLFAASAPARTCRFSSARSTLKKPPPLGDKGLSLLFPRIPSEAKERKGLLKFQRTTDFWVFPKTSQEPLDETNRIRFDSKVVSSSSLEKAKRSVGVLERTIYINSLFLSLCVCVSLSLSLKRVVSRKRKGRKEKRNAELRVLGLVVSNTILEDKKKIKKDKKGQREQRDKFRVSN